MYANQGAHRIYLLGKRIMLFGSLAVIAFWVLMFILRGGGALMELVILTAVPLAGGATLWLVAWIVDGFVTSSGHK